VQPIVKDHISFAQRLDIPFAGFVQVRVNAGTHQAGDLHALTADVLDNIGDHTRGGNSPYLAAGDILR
jgi:hypothetical protein